jgi:ubiquinone/menaquinone biosynthesis C-methylase UbiE
MVDTFDIFQICLVILIGFLLANYLYARWSLRERRRTEISMEEGFANPGAEKEDAQANTIVLGNEHLFDDFYAKIYDKIVDGEVRQEAETSLTLNWVKQYRPETKTVLALDVGCGTGTQVELLRKAGLGKVVGIDKSDAMIARGRTLHPKADLRVGDAEIIGAFAAGEFNLITMYYFTFYYLRDRTVALKNMFSWLQPGGLLVIHVVNREKFDPILESASPFVAFSVQKYSKERVTRSRVAFDKFDYEANFELEGPVGQFQEVFKFKNGKRRKQVHHLRMPTMAEITAEVEGCGFKYKQYIDLTGVGYEYQYLFCFSR